MAYEGYADTDSMALLLAWANNRIRGGKTARYVGTGVDRDTRGGGGSGVASPMT
jgi:hypothetical protein